MNPKMQLFFTITCMILPHLVHAVGSVENGQHYNGTHNHSYTVLEVDDGFDTVIFQNQREGSSKAELSYLKQYYNNPNHTTYNNLIFKSISRNSMKYNIRYQMDMNQPPDVIGWYAGGEVTRSLIGEGHAHNLHNFFTEYKLYDLLPRSLLQGVSDDNGHPYALPTDMYHWGVYYDTRVFSRLSLSPPSTWDEFLHVCKVLKDDGIVPITLGIKWLWPLGGWMDYLNMRINGPEFHVQLCAGEIPFDDTRVVKVFEEWKRLIDLGYFVPFEEPSTHNWFKMVADLESGNAGMALMGDFLRSDVDKSIQNHFDWFKFPEIVPGVPSGEDVPTDGYIIPEKAMNKKGAYEFLAHLVSTDIQVQRVTDITTSMSANSFANEAISDPRVLKGAQMLNEADYTLQFYDRDTDPAFASIGMKMMYDFMANPSEYNSLLQELEVKRREHYLGLAPMPVISVKGGTYSHSLTVNITTKLEDAFIFYTTDESAPTRESLLYEGPIRINTHGRFVIRAIVSKEGLADSSIAQESYSLNLKTPVTIGVRAARMGIYWSSINIVITIVLAVLVFYHRNTSVFRASSPLFVILMLFGVIIALSSGVVMSIDPVLGYDHETTNTMCMVQAWTISIGWALAFGSLLAKTYRIIAFFGNSGLSNKVISNAKLGIMVLLMLLLEVAICASWASISPVQYLKFEDSTHVWNACYGRNFQTFMSISLLPKVLMLVAAVAVSVKTRDYAAAFNESKMIGFAVYNLAFIEGSSFALSFAMKELSIAHTIRVVGLNITCLILAFAIAMKPLYILYWKPELNNADSLFHSSSTKRGGLARVSDGHGFATKTDGIMMTRNSIVPLNDSEQSLEHHAMEA